MRFLDAAAARRLSHWRSFRAKLKAVEHCQQVSKRTFLGAEAEEEKEEEEEEEDVRMETEGRIEMSNRAKKLLSETGGEKRPNILSRVPFCHRIVGGLPWWFM
jgi:hypothetical protein